MKELATKIFIFQKLTPTMEGILSLLLVPDNDTIKAATAELRTAFKHPGVIPELCSVLTTSTSVQIRQYAAVLLRKVGKFLQVCRYCLFAPYAERSFRNQALG